MPYFFGNSPAISAQPAENSPPANVAEAPYGRRQALSSALRRVAFACLLLLAVSIPFSIKGAVLFFRLAVLFWLAFLLVRLFRREKVSFRPSVLLLPMLAFLVWVSLSTVFSYEPLLSWGRMRTVSLLFVAVLVSQIPQTYREVKVLVAVLLFAVAVNLGHTAWQYIYGTGVELANLSNTGPLAKAGLIQGDVVQAIDGVRIQSPRQLLREVQRGSPSDLLEMQISRGAPSQRWILRLERGALGELSFPGSIDRGRPVRAQGFYRHYIPYAEFLTLCGTLVFAFAVAYRHHPRWVKVGLGVFFVAVIAALTFTATRAALAALLVGCFAVLWVRAGRTPRLVGVGIAAAVLVVAFVWFQHVRGSWESQDAGTHYRELMWADGVRLAREHPWLGVGMDSVHNRWNEWGIRAYQEYPNLKSHFHSSYVQLAVECGLPALAIWLWLLGSYLWLAYKMCQQVGSDEFSDAMALAALGTAIAFAGLGVMHYVIGDSEPMMLFWLIVGLTWWFRAYQVNSLYTHVMEPAAS